MNDGNRWRPAMHPNNLSKLLLFGIVLVTLCTAGWLFREYQAVDRHLWTSGDHDRNAHCLFMFKLTTDVREGMILSFLKDVDSAKMWPPFQGILGMLILLVGGMSYSLAVIPALIGWVLLVIFGFLCARRAAGAWGNVAGLMAFLFLITSPAHRAYAVDVMLESLGAGLTMMALYWYLAMLQDETHSRWPARWLGLSLTALLLHKYNYWTLLLCALFADRVLSVRRERLQVILDYVQNWDYRTWFQYQARQPLNYVFLALALLSAIVMFRGPKPFWIAGKSMTIHPPYNIINAAYTVLFVRLVLAWYRGGRSIFTSLPLATQTLIRWHLFPLMVYLLLPKRVGYLFFFVSPANGANISHFDPLWSAERYWQWMRMDYFASTAAMMLAISFLFVAMVGVLRGALPSGTRAVVLLPLVGFVLVVLHPNQKARFLHSWVAVTYVSVGVGLAYILSEMGRISLPLLRPAIGVASLAGVCWAQATLLLETGKADEGGPRPTQPSLLDLSDYYLPELGRQERTSLICGVPYRFTAEWTFLERYGRLDPLERHWFGFKQFGSSNREGFQRWLDRTSATTIVCLEPIPGTYGWGSDDLSPVHREVVDLLWQQRSYEMTRVKDFPHLSCRVSIWKKSSPIASR